MANIQDVISTRVEYDNKFEQRQDKPWGIIIALEGNLHPPGRENFSYIAMYGRPGSAFEVVNDTALKTVGTPVQLVRDAILPYYRVIGAYTDGVPQANQPVSNSSVGPHGENHQIPTEANIGEDPVYIYPPAWKPLKCSIPSNNVSGPRVEIEEFVYTLRGVRRTFIRTQLDLSFADGGTGFDVMVLIYLNPLTNTLQTVESDPFTSTTPENAPLPYNTVFYNTYPSAQVRVRGDATVINTEDITDARLLSPNLNPDYDIDLLPIRISSTGLLEGGIITIATATTVDISAGNGQIIDNTVEPPEITQVSWAAFNGVTISGLMTDILTDFGILLDGTLLQQVTPFTRAQYRDIIILGRVAHVDFASIISIAPFMVPIHDNTLLAVDIMSQVGPFLEGYIYSDNGPALLEMARTEGELMRVGVSFHTTPKDPHIRLDPALSPVEFAYSVRDGIGGWTYDLGIGTGRTDIDPGFWDDGTGVLNSVVPARWTAQRIYIANGTGGSVMQYGQQEYFTQSDALVDLFAQNFETDPAIQELTTFWGWLVVRGNANDLSDISEATFVDAATGTINSSGNTIFELFTYLPILTGETFKLSTLYRLDASAGSLLIDLPAAPSTGSFVEFVINAITPPNTITIDGNGDTIDGSATVVYANDFDIFRKIRMVFDTEWHEYRDNAGMDWQGTWVSKTYDLDDVVYDSGWTMIANKITTDRPAPQPLGPPFDLLPDAPTWAIVSIVDTVLSGVDLEITDGLWSLTNLGGWVQDFSGSTKYRLWLIDVNSGESTLSPEFDGALLTAPGWVDISLEANLLAQGDHIQLALLSDNHSATTMFTGNWIHSVGTVDVSPGTGESYRRTNRTYIRFNYTDNDAGDRTAELQSVLFDTAITSSLGASYTIIDAIDGGTFIEYEILIIAEPITGLQLWTFDIPTPISTDYVRIVDHWLGQPSPNATIQGIFRTGTLDPVNDNNAYGVRFTIQEYTASDDWELVALNLGVSGGGGSGGVDTFDLLSDTPASKVGEANKIVAVNVGETALEYITNPAGAYIYIDESGPSPGFIVSAGEFYVTDLATDLQLPAGDPIGSVIRFHFVANILPNVSVLSNPIGETINGVSGSLTIIDPNSTWECVKNETLNWSVTQVNRFPLYDPDLSPSDVMELGRYYRHQFGSNSGLFLPVGIDGGSVFLFLEDSGNIVTINPNASEDVAAAFINGNATLPIAVGSSGDSSELWQFVFHGVGITEPGWQAYRQIRSDRDALGAYKYIDETATSTITAVVGEFYVTDNVAQIVNLPAASATPIGSAIRVHNLGAGLSTGIFTLTADGSDTLNEDNSSNIYEGFDTTWEIICTSATNWSVQKVGEPQAYERLDLGPYTLKPNHYYAIDQVSASTYTLPDITASLGVTLPRIHVWIDSLGGNATFTYSGQINGSNSDVVIPGGTDNQMLIFSFNRDADFGWNYILIPRSDRDWIPGSPTGEGTLSSPGHVNINTGTDDPARPLIVQGPDGNPTGWADNLATAKTVLLLKNLGNTDFQAIVEDGSSSSWHVNTGTNVFVGRTNYSSATGVTQLDAASETHLAVNGVPGLILDSSLNVSVGPSLGTAKLHIVADDLGTTRAFQIDTVHQATGDQQGVQIAPVMEPANAIGNPFGFVNSMKFANSVFGVTEAVALQSQVELEAGYTGTITRAFALNIANPNKVEAGAVLTNNNGIRVSNLTTGSGTNRGLVMEVDAASTSPHNIYVSGTAPNYFAGAVGIGDTAPGKKFSVISAGNVADFKDSSAATNFRGIINFSSAGYTNALTIAVANFAPGDARVRANLGILHLAGQAEIHFTHISTIRMRMALGLQVGSSVTGGDKGNGTINVQTNIFRQNAVYTHPGGILEMAYRGKIEKFAAPIFKGYKGLPSLDEVEAYMKEHLRLPLRPNSDMQVMGVFDHDIFNEAQIEMLWLHTVIQGKQITKLQDQVDRLISFITGDTNG